MTPEERACFDRLLASAPSGPRIEFGVLHGATLKLMAVHAGPTIGVDGFAGMPPPGPRDMQDGRNPYPQGRLAAPMAEAASAAPGAQLIRGFVPAVLQGVPEGPYGFAHVDLDHYEPTRAAMCWLWPRMLPGGVICADDWFADRDCLAAAALNEFAKEHPLAGSSGRKAWWIC